MKYDKINYSNVKAIKHEYKDGYYSVCCYVELLDMYVWFDVEIVDNDVECDWNKYIFFLDNNDDLKIRDFQENIEMFELIDSISVDYLCNNGLIYQGDGDDYKWYDKNKEIELV